LKFLDDVPPLLRQWTTQYEYFDWLYRDSSPFLLYISTTYFPHCEKQEPSWQYQSILLKKYLQNISAVTVEDGKG